MVAKMIWGGYGPIRHSLKGLEHIRSVWQATEVYSSSPTIQNHVSHTHPTIRNHFIHQVPNRLSRFIHCRTVLEQLSVWSKRGSVPKTKRYIVTYRSTYVHAYISPFMATAIVLCMHCVTHQEVHNYYIRMYVHTYICTYIYYRHTYHKQPLTGTDNRNLKFLCISVNKIDCSTLVHSCIRGLNTRQQKMGQTVIHTIAWYVEAAVRLKSVLPSPPVNLWISDTISFTHQTDGSTGFNSDQWWWRGDDFWVTWRDMYKTRRQ